MRIATLSLLACLAFVASADDEPDSYDYGPSLEDVQFLIQSLEDTTADLFADMSRAQTLTGVVDQRLDNIQLSFLDRHALSNQQQNHRIESYAQQVKDLDHRRVDASSLESSVSTEANDTAFRQSRQVATVDNLLFFTDEEQQMDLDGLVESIPNTKAALLNVIEADVNQVKEQNDLLDSIVDITASLVDGRQCEYGTGTYEVGLHDVLFVSDFGNTTEPSLALSLTGFVAHLDQHSYEKHVADIKYMDVYADYISTSGFGVVVEDNSEGEVQVKSATVSWMACNTV